MNLKSSGIIVYYIMQPDHAMWNADSGYGEVQYRKQGKLLRYISVFLQRDAGNDQEGSLWLCL